MLLIFVRTLILFGMVVLFIRLMGKRQVGQMQPFEFVITMLMADMVASPMQDIRLPLMQGIIPLLALFLAHNLITFFSLKSDFMRLVFCGRPSVLIEKGKVSRREMNRMNINLNDLMENLRVKGAPNVEDILYATLETNGDMSVILTTGASPVTNDSAKIKAEETGRPVIFIMDGKINRRNIGVCGFEPENLINTLYDMGFATPKEVFFASVDDTGRVYAQGYGDDPAALAAYVKVCR